MIQAAIHRQPWPLGRAANFPTNAPMNRASHLCSVSARHLYSLPIADFELPISRTLKRQSEIGNQKSEMLFPSLPRFQLQLHIGITDALAFVGIGLSQLVHLRAHLAKLLFVDAGNRQSRLILLNISFSRQALGFGFDAFR